RRENVDRHGELLRRGVSCARPDDHVYEREADGLRFEREVLRDGHGAFDDYARRARLISKQPHAQRVGARRDATDLVAALIVARGAEPTPFGADRRPRERTARRVRDTAPDDPALSERE